MTIKPQQDNHQNWWHTINWGYVTATRAIFIIIFLCIATEYRQKCKMIQLDYFKLKKLSKKCGCNAKNYCSLRNAPIDPRSITPTVFFNEVMITTIIINPSRTVVTFRSWL